MTDKPLPRPSFGRALGETSRLIKKLHDRALADHGTDFPTWMLLTLLTEKGAALPVEEVVRELDRRMDLDRPDAMRVLERAVAAGHVAHLAERDPAAVGMTTVGMTTVAMTEAGTAYFGVVYADSRAATDLAFQGIDPGELDSALTVLLAAAERAAAALV